MLLRVITIIGIVIALAFLAWSMLVMTGGRDWLVATMTEEEGPAKVAAKDEAPKDAGTKPAEPEQAGAKPKAKPEEPKPDTADAQAKPEDTKPDAADTAATNEAAGEGAADAPPAPAGSADDKDEADSAEKPADGGEAAGVDPAGNPTETATSAEKGSLKSPYQDSYAEVAEEGHKKYMAAGCNGCHGGTGGGGMGPPLSNPVWVYGNDGDTLFRLIALGTAGLQEQGYTRKGSELVVGPMPPHGNIVKSNDDMWKIIAWIWSINPPDKSASAAQ